MAVLGGTDVEKIFDALSGELVHTIDGPTTGAVYFAQDDKTLLCDDAEWDVASGKKVRPLQSEQLLRLLPPEDKIGWGTWSADGRYFIGPDAGSKVWDAATGKVVFRLPEEIGGTNSWDFSSDGKSLAMATYQGPLRIWELATVRATSVYPSLETLSDVKWSPDGKHLIVGRPNFTRGSILFETKTWQGIQGCKVGINPTVVWSRDGRAFAGYAEGDNGVGFWDVASAVNGKPQQVLQGTAECTIISLSPDGKWAALASGKDKTVGIWSVATGKKARNLEGAIGNVISCSPGRRTVPFLPQGRTARSIW